MADKKTIIGLVLIFLIFIGYQMWTSPSKEEKAEIARVDSIAQVERNALEDSLRRISDVQNATEVEDNILLQSGNDSVKNVITNKKAKELSFFSNTVENEEKKYTVENEFLTLDFSNKGGRIASIKLKDYKDYNKKDVCLLEEESSKYNITLLLSNDTLLQTEKLLFELVDADKLPSKSISGEDSLQLVFRAYVNAEGSDTDKDMSKYIEFNYTLYGNQYMLGHSIRMVGLQQVIRSNTQELGLEWNNEIFRQEKNQKNERALSSVYYKPLNGDVDNLPDGRDKNEKLSMPLKWLSYKQQFFSTTLIAETSFNNANVEINSNVEGKDVDAFLCNINSEIGIPYQHIDDYQFHMNIYMGPNKFNILSDYKLDLERQIPLGWGFFLLQWINRFAVIPVFNFFEQFNWNYGLIILILTVLLKIVLLPIAIKSYKSSAVMKILQPEINEINKKYSKPDQAMDKSKATMALYKKAGASPMSGCIPMLLQFPIIIAMFRFFPASIELRHQPFLWADDLSSYDSVLDLPFTIPFYGDHVSLFCLLMSVVNILYTRINMSQTPQSNNMPGMKTMMTLMPVMFLFVLNNYSSGLNFYYFLSTCFSFLQIWIVRKTINEDKIKDKIRLAELKPVKKSSFMKRIEQMQKANEQAGKQKKK